MKCLKIKVFFIGLFRRLKLIPDVWYKSELNLAEAKAKDLSEYFSTDNARRIVERKLGKPYVTAKDLERRKAKALKYNFK